MTMDQPTLNLDELVCDALDESSYKLPFCRDVSDSLDFGWKNELEGGDLNADLSLNFNLKQEPSEEMILSRSSLCNSPSSMNSNSPTTSLPQAMFMSERPDTPLQAARPDLTGTDIFFADSLNNSQVPSNFLGDFEQLLPEPNLESSDPYQYLNEPILGGEPGEFALDEELGDGGSMDGIMFLSPASPPSLICSSKRKRITNPVSHYKSNNLFSASTINTIKEETPIDCSSFSKNKNIYSTSLLSPLSAASLDTSSQQHQKSGVKRKLTGTPVYICDPKSQATTSAVASSSGAGAGGSNAKLISVRSMDKSSVQLIKSVQHNPHNRAHQRINNSTGVELNDLVVQQQQGGKAEVKPFAKTLQIPAATLQSFLKSKSTMVKRVDANGQLSNICIKTEPGTSCEMVGQQLVKIAQQSLHTASQQQLPPTPPSSTSSDTETSPRASKKVPQQQQQESLSPSSSTSSSKSSPTLIRVHPTITANTLATQLMSSNPLSQSQRLTQSHGPLILTEEERKTLLAEGYKVPSKLPLTKSEEKSLKKVRRKIKNKISAQESRRKKKEYVEKLEKKMDMFSKENGDLKRKVNDLESSNRSLIDQLKSLHNLIGKIPKTSTVTTQTSSCLMMLALSFVFFVGGWIPMMSENASNSSAPSLLSSQQQQADDYSSASTSMGSRVLMSYNDDSSEENISLDGDDVATTSAATSAAGGVVAINKILPASACKIVNKVWIDRNLKGMPGGKVRIVGETYDKGRTNLANINDTGEDQHQMSKIIANTMEPRATEVIATSTRKLATSNGGRVEVLIPVTQGGALDIKRRQLNTVTQYLIKE